MKVKDEEGAMKKSSGKKKVKTGEVEDDDEDDEEEEDENEDVFAYNKRVREKERKEAEEQSYLNPNREKWQKEISAMQEWKRKDKEGDDGKEEKDNSSRNDRRKTGNYKANAGTKNRFEWKSKRTEG
eukprot:MONOS_4924.1-p1 / transcript=MONOS_4924.1 / gene=MONOS_4924 / organism=Monocercomonoides_exilis_PA203 / gene_product=unspecified product / transcript_product=unspecified product / location=Mono_scaffold00138:10336-10716(+) / protein_length=127 / sequence_SO=supercontig / SO=protein_coding / is_pseudo=false